MADLLAMLRARNVAIDEIRGWQQRGRPGTWDPQGVMVHHTAGRDSLSIIIHGRSDLPGPLSNFHVPKERRPNLVAAGRCNHAGSGAARVLDEVRHNIAPVGDAAARGLSDTTNGNGAFYGIEAENLGDGADPWPPGQLDTIAAICAAICAGHRWSPNRVIGHREWTRRKPDPRGFSMDSMRSRVAALLAGPKPPPPPPPDDEEQEMAYRYAFQGAVYTTDMVFRQHWESGGPGFPLMVANTKDLGEVPADFHESLTPAS